MATNAMLERVARAVAARKAAIEFNQVEEHDIVKNAVEGRWRDEVEGVRAVVLALRDPLPEAVAAVKPAKDRPEAVEHFNAVLTSIAG